MKSNNKLLLETNFLLNFHPNKHTFVALNHSGVFQYGLLCKKTWLESHDEALLPHPLATFRAHCVVLAQQTLTIDTTRTSVAITFMFKHSILRLYHINIGNIHKLHGTPAQRQYGIKISFFQNQHTRRGLFQFTLSSNLVPKLELTVLNTGQTRRIRDFVR